MEIVDPTHPLYGKTLPLLGITFKQLVGRAAIVWIHPGLERIVPLSATSLANALVVAPPSACCRLSLASVERLLSVVASFSQIDPEEEAHAEKTAPPLPAQLVLPLEEPISLRSEKKKGPSQRGVADAGVSVADLGEREVDCGDAGGGF